jgi:hypothetical protein
MVEKMGKNGRVGKPNGKSTAQTTSINNFDLSDERFCMFIGDLEIFIGRKWNVYR